VNTDIHSIAGKSFQQWYWDIWIFIGKKNELGIYVTYHIKINLRDHKFICKVQISTGLNIYLDGNKKIFCELGLGKERFQRSDSLNDKRKI
jgi:hypothetical protein